MLKAIVKGIASHEKEKQKKAKPGDWEYLDLYEQNVLYSSDYLKDLAKGANTKAKRNAIHNYMNKFREGGDDIYEVETYKQISDYLISKEKRLW